MARMLQRIRMGTSSLGRRTHLHRRWPPEMVRRASPQGTVIEFTMSSAESKMYPGIAREAHTFGTPDPKNPAKLIVTTSHPAPYIAKVAVYVPKQYVTGTVAPFIVGADGPDRALFIALDNLIAEHRVPAMIAISIGNGGGDAQGSERGPGIRHDVGPVCGVRGDGSPAAGGERKRT